MFVALALVGRPELVFLDELTQNLDPLSRRRTWEIVRRVRDSGTTVVLVTHDVEEAERLCDRIVVLDRGHVVADGRPTEIVEALGGTATVRFTDPDLDVRSMDAVPGVTSVGRHGPEVHVTGTGPLLAHVGAHLVTIGRPPIDLRVDRPSSGRPVRRHDQGMTINTATTATPITPANRDGLGRIVARLTFLELRLLLREPGLIVGLIAFPAVMVLVLAGVFGTTPIPSSAECHRASTTSSATSASSSPRWG